jgi:hypothetical protein
VQNGVHATLACTGLAVTAELWQGSTAVLSASANMSTYTISVQLTQLGVFNVSFVVQNLLYGWSSNAGVLTNVCEQIYTYVQHCSQLQLTVIAPLRNITVKLCKAGGTNRCNVNSGDMLACPWQIVPRYDVDVHIDTQIGAIEVYWKR